MWDPPNAKSGQAYAGTKFYWNVLGVLLGALYSLARMIAVRHQRTATRGPLQDRTKKKIGRIKHVDMQDDVVRLATGLQLESQADPAVSLVCSGVVAGGDGINKGKEAGLRPTALVQLVDDLGPLVVYHGLEAFFGNITGTKAIQIVADLLVIG